jgi:hypothetical protein
MRRLCPRSSLWAETAGYMSISFVLLCFEHSMAFIGAGVVISFALDGGGNDGRFFLYIPRNFFFAARRTDGDSFPLASL